MRKNLSWISKILNKKEKHCYHDHDDSDYHGIKDIENLFGKVGKKDYYKPILAKSSFNDNYKKYETREDKKYESTGDKKQRIYQ